MPISAVCSNCGKSYKVSSKFAGKKAKCTDCGQSFSIPALAAATPASALAPASSPDPYGDLTLLQELAEETPAPAAMPAKSPRPTGTGQHRRAPPVRATQHASGACPRRDIC